MRWSIIVCTHNRSGEVRENLPKVAGLDYPDDLFEGILVDNASTDDTQGAARDVPRARYFREDAPGLSHARNRGIREARGEFIAFIDDDASPERDWLQRLEKAFEDPLTACAGGKVVPAWQGDRT